MRSSAGGPKRPRSERYSRAISPRRAAMLRSTAASRRASCASRTSPSRSSPDLVAVARHLDPRVLPLVPELVLDGPIDRGEPAAIATVARAIEPGEELLRAPEIAAILARLAPVVAELAPVVADLGLRARQSGGREEDGGEEGGRADHAFISC